MIEVLAQTIKESDRYPIPLKDTFQVYEMWCNQKIVNNLRESVFVSNQGIYFLRLKTDFFT